MLCLSQWLSRHHNCLGHRRICHLHNAYTRARALPFDPQPIGTLHDFMPSPGCRYAATFRPH